MVLAARKGSMTALKAIKGKPGKIRTANLMVGWFAMGGDLRLAERMRFAGTLGQNLGCNQARLRITWAPAPMMSTTPKNVQRSGMAPNTMMPKKVAAMTWA